MIRPVMRARGGVGVLGIVGAGLLVFGCTAAAPPAPRSAREVIMAYDDAVRGVIWVGVRKTGGAPTIWASRIVSGQAFVRNIDPHNAMGLLPTKRTPMLRLEIAP